MITINNDSQSLGTQQILNSSQSKTETAIERLASGKQLNSAKDDAANLAIALKYASELSSGQQAYRNINDGISMLQVAEGGLGEMNQLVGRMEELAIRSGNGSLNSDDRSALQSEMDGLQQEVMRLAEATTFNGNPLLSGGDPLQLQLGTEAGDGLTVAGIDATAELGGLGFGTIDISSAASTPAALDIIGQAQTFISDSRGSIASNMNRIESAAASLQVEQENVAAAKSRIEDADYARQIADLTASMIQNQSGQAMLAQANVSSQTAMAMLNI
ncbi:MAG: flagellin [Gammaproteobacteria bacterium]|nr:flagellin [Gammaproteobacteria bacterium]